MAGALMLLKLLHCRNKCQKLKTFHHEPVRDEDQHFLQGNSNPRTLNYTNQEEVQLSTCRVCLKEGDIPIFGDKVVDEIPEALTTFGGVEIEEDDPYPKYLCNSCHALLQGAILFRKTAQKSDMLLKKPQETEPYSSDDNGNGTDDEMTNDIASEYASEDNEDVEHRNYHCKRCNIEFESFADYSEHRLTDEHENRRETCPVCQKSYTALYFKKHLALHKRECPYMCDICGKKFIVQGQFKRHRLTHFYELPFKCSLCPYRGRFRESLKMHMRSHTGEKPYQCSQCAARFVNKSNLNKHMLTHKGEHDYKCDSCGRGFYTKRSLDLHIKVDHTGVKDHVCDICFKAFGYRKQMMKHQLKVHKRQKLKSGRLPLYLQVDKMRNGQT